MTRKLLEKLEIGKIYYWDCPLPSHRRGTPVLVVEFDARQRIRCGCYKVLIDEKCYWIEPSAVTEEPFSGVDGV